jgi:hypothetical protein
MGTYYDIVCPEHREVLRLWKADILWGKLEYLVSVRKLLRERINSYKEFIVVSPSVFRLVVKERPKSKQWLEKHKTCKLLFVDSEYKDAFNYYDGYALQNGQ